MTILRDLHFEEYRTPDENPGLAALIRAQVGAPFALASFLDEETFDRDPATRALLRPQKIDKGLLVALERQDTCLSYMNVLLRKNQPELGQEHEKLVAFLARHVTRSLQLGHAIAQRNGRRSAAELRVKAGRTADGLMLLDRRCRVVDADANALAVLDCRTGLALRQGVLISTSITPGQDTQSLHHFILAEVYWDRPFVVRASDGTINIAEVSPAQHGTFLGPARGHRHVSVRRLSPHQRYEVAAIGSAYGLTKGELRALDVLCQEPTITAGAKRLGVTRDTMKTHLAQIYAKTQCRSLAELMRLVGRFQ